MRGYYIILDPISEITFTGGVWKKIQAQIKILNKVYIETKLLDCSCDTTNLLNKILKRISPNYFIKNLPNDFYFCDFYYIRYNFSTVPLLKLLKNIKQYGKGKIIIEIPTYPYYKEFKHGIQQFTLFLDKILNRQLRKYADMITTYSKHDMIFNIPTIEIKNGIDCSLIPIINKTIHKNNLINFICVASFSNWHGYDRLIAGLNNYYKQKFSQKVYIHFIGDGTEINLLKNIVLRYNLSKYIIFHGFLFGEKLTEIFNKSDIAVCSLGSHRKGIYLSSELKSREYLARGIPMISSAKIDVLPDEYKYCLYIPEDDSPVDIQNIIQFYQNLNAMNNISDISREIRQFAENNCDMSVTMRPVIDYLSHI